MKKIIVAVSGGPDSMALLHMMNEKGYQIIAAHVNYMVRENSSDDQKVIMKYVKNTDIDLHVLRAPKHTEGNFQAFAREIRYDYMLELAKEHDVDEIYVAHHEDDHIETYLIQKMRNSIPTYYGLNETSKYKGMVVKRPLLHMSKRQLIAYCHNHELEYVIDESNLENDYTRNLIRNTTVSIFTEEKRKEILEEIKVENLKLNQRRSDVAKRGEVFFKTKRLSDLLDLSDEDIVDILRMHLKGYDIYDISNKEYDHILDFLKSENNSDYKLTEEYILSKAYDELKILKNVIETYEYSFDEVVDFKCDYFSIKQNGSSTEAVTVSPDDFPITIRNYREGDEIKMRFGTKKVNRFFIDRKIPEYERKLWPIVENVHKEIILVPGLGCNLTHYSNIPSMFVVK